jgi:hypothetical protein
MCRANSVKAGRHSLLAILEAVFALPEQSFTVVISFVIVANSYTPQYGIAGASLHKGYARIFEFSSPHQAFIFLSPVFVTLRLNS